MEISKIWFEDNSIFLKTKTGVEKSMPLTQKVVSKIEKCKHKTAR